MAFLDHNGESEFLFSKDEVFTAVCRAIPTLKGMKIETADKLSGRILVKAGVSLHSWGENIPIELSAISDGMTKVKITSSPKTGIMFGGAMDMGKNRKNIEQILQTTSAYLSSNQITQQKSTSTISNHNQMLQHYDIHKLKNDNWYEKTWLVIVLCIVFFPLGLYALWKNSSIGKTWKIVITVLIAIVVISKLSADEKEPTKSVTTIENDDTDSKATEMINDDTEKSISEKDIVKEKLKERAERDWPNDYTTQEFWMNEQLDAYDYMLGIEENSIKKQAQRDWPLDFVTQKFWYDEQIEAKERMNQ